MKKITLFYYNEWLKGDWQVQKIHAEEFLDAFARQQEFAVHSFPERPAGEKGSPGIDARPEKKSFKQSIRKILYPSLHGMIDPLSMVMNKHQLLRQVKRVKPDIVMARHSGFFPIIGALTKIRQPLILEVNSLIANDFQLSGLDMPPDILKHERDIVCRASALVCVTRSTADSIQAMGVPDDRIFVVPNGVDPVKFSPRRKSSDLMSRFRLDGYLVVGYVGGFEKDQPEGRDVMGMLESFQTVRERANCPLKMLMIGKMDEGYLRIEAGRMGIGDAIEFSGLVTHEQVPEFMNLIDIAVAPYKSSHLLYRSPVKLFEYMAMEKPTLIPAIGQTTEILSDGKQAMLVKPDSTTAMAEGLLRLIRDGALRRRIGENARSLVLEQYTWDHNASTIADVCRLILKSGDSALKKNTQG